MGPCRRGSPRMDQQISLLTVFAAELLVVLREVITERQLGVAWCRQHRR